jgi:hypothetical protein
VLGIDAAIPLYSLQKDHNVYLQGEKQFMFNTTVKRMSISMLTGMVIFASGTVAAKEAYDGKSNFICATQGVMACVDGAICSKGQARDFDMPDFMMVDFKGKVIRAFYDGDKEATSPIKYMESSGSQLILQGVENNHGWSLAVHRESGRMNVGVSGSEVSFSLFGACQVL